MLRLSIWSGLLALFMAAYCVHGSVLGIDLGSQWYKLATIRAGAGFDIVLNAQSSRKTHTMVGWNKEERAFASDAYNLQARYPANSYGYITPLLGKSYDHPFLQQVKDWITFSIEEDTTRNSILIRHNAETAFSPEELVAMILRHAKEHVSTVSGTTLKDCVITVPPYLTQHERQAVLDAAEIAGLNVLALLNDVTAFALNYAMDRNFDNDTQNVIFYDVGATGAKALLATFQSVPDIKKKNKTITQVLVRSQAWDQTLGGRFLDRSLANYFKKVIKEKYPDFNVDDVKVSLRLLREAQKIKEILSANQAAQAQIVGLGDHDDLTILVTRKQFEELNKDVAARVAVPLQQLLAEANLTKEDIRGVEIVGGTSRVPMIQNAIKEYLGRDVDRHLNGDEAAAIGAAYYAATMSSRLRVKEIRLRDVTPYPVNVKINLDQEGEATNEVVIEQEEGDDKTSAALLSRYSRLNTSRSLTFFSYSNFSLDLSYAEPAVLPAGSKTEISHIQVTGMPYPEKHNLTGKPKVHASFRLTTSGIVILDRARVELTVTELAKTKAAKAVPPKAPETVIKNEEPETPAAEEEAKPEAPAAEDEQPKQETQDEQTTDKEHAEPHQEGEQPESDTHHEEQPAEEHSEEEEAEPAAEGAEAPATEELRYVTKTIKLPLKIASVETLGVKSLNTEARLKSEMRLSNYDWQDKQRKELEKEKNNLESFIYETRDKLYNDDIVEASTEEEREALSAALSAASDWLDENSETAHTAEYRSQIRTLREKADKISFRIKEQRAFPKAAAELRKTIDLAREVLHNITEVLNVTEEERDAALGKIEAINTWFEPKQLEQFALAKNVDPVVTSEELSRKQTEIEVTLRPLLRRPKKKKPYVPKVKLDEETEDGEGAEQTEQGESTQEGQEPTTSEPEPAHDQEPEPDEKTEEATEEPAAAEKTEIPKEEVEAEKEVPPPKADKKAKAETKGKKEEKKGGKKEETKGKAKDSKGKKEEKKGGKTDSKKNKNKDEL